MAMGSPLGPLFANIFLSHHEHNWLRNSPVKPLLYKRYVDNTLLLIPMNSDIPKLLEYLNSQHKNIRFTCESEVNDSISFIGILITCIKLANNMYGYQTTVYRKPTNTSLLMNFNCFTALSYHLSVIKCLVHRALHLYSTWNLFHNEINFIRTLMLRNAYPSLLVDRIIKNSLSKFYNPAPIKFGPKKERLYIGLPFLGKPTDAIRRSIKQICKQFLPNKDAIIYFKPGPRTSHFFRLKDVTPFEMRSHVVYMYTCASCNASYIGQTTRHIPQRISEHRGVSHLTGKVMKSQVHSSIRDHVLLCRNADCQQQNFKILATGCNE